MDRDKFYICYSGNIGHSQNLELLLDTADAIQTQNPDIRFVLIGEGAAKNELEEKIKARSITNMILLPFQPYEDIAHVFSLGDVGLIISKPGIGGSSVPSKTWSIMAAKRPILASFDLDSELSHHIDRIKCGVTVDASKKNQFIAEVLKLAKETNQQYGENGYRYVTESITKENCTRQYVDVIRQAVARSNDDLSS